MTFTTDQLKLKLLEAEAECRRLYFEIGDSTLEQGILISEPENEDEFCLSLYQAAVRFGPKALLAASIANRAAMIRELIRRRVERVDLGSSVVKS